MHDRYAQCFIVNSVELAELGKHFYTLHDQLLELLHNMRQFYIKKKNKDWSMLCADSDLSNIEMEIKAIDVSHSQIYFGRYFRSCGNPAQTCTYG